MKCIKKTVRHYWKYQYTTWTRPNLTSNTSYGTLTSNGATSGQPAYKMYDGNVATNSSYFESQTKPNLVTWTLPEDDIIKVTSIDFYNKYATQGKLTKTIKLYAGPNRTIPLTDVITVNVGSKALTHIDIPVENQYASNVFAIDFISTAYDSIGAQEVYITAQKQTVVAGTSQDYDFYTDDEVSELPRINNKYYGINQ